MHSSRLYSKSCTGYFTRLFRKSDYDLQELRISLDEFSFQSSCAFGSQSESIRHLNRSERCKILLEALGPKQETNLSDSFFGITMGLFGVAFGASASPKSPKALLAILATACLIALFYYLYRLFMVAAQNRLREALLIIMMESKPSDPQEPR